MAVKVAELTRGLRKQRMLQFRRSKTLTSTIRRDAALAAAALFGALLLGCGKEDSASGKLLVSEKTRIQSTEFALARAHDFDRACQRLYLQVPVGTQLRDATAQAQNALAADDPEETPMTVRRWDYVLMHGRQRPETYESIFIGQWRPHHRGSGGPEYVLFAPLRCVVSESTIAIFELEPPFAEAADVEPAKRAAAIVAKYSHVPAGVGESVEQRTRDFATSDKANVGETAAISVIIKEADTAKAAPAASGSSSRN